MNQDAPTRPDPDALLAEAKRQGRGRLRVYLGMAPGVGKTYEMLTAGKRRKSEGLDVVVGVVETHGRKDTEALTEGLEVLSELMSGEPVEHDGAFYRASDVRYLPVAARPGGIPIWLAARWPNLAPLRRAAKYQGVFVIGLTDPADVAELRWRLSDSGANLERFDIVVLGAIGDDSAAWDEAGVTWRLAQIGPFGIDLTTAREIVLAGPPR